MPQPLTHLASRDVTRLGAEERKYRYHKGLNATEYSKIINITSTIPVRIFVPRAPYQQGPSSATKTLCRVTL